MGEREKRAWSLPTIHLESATDVPEGQHPELPGGGDITQDPSLPPSLRKDQVSANENVHSDVTDLHTYEAENHPENDSVQSVTQSITVVQDLVGERLPDRHSVPGDTERTQE